MAPSLSLGTAGLELAGVLLPCCCCSAADLDVSCCRAPRSLPSGVDERCAYCWRLAAGVTVRGVRGTLLGGASRTLRGVASGRTASPPLLEGHLLDRGAAAWPPRLLGCRCSCGVPDKLDRLSFGIFVLDPTMGLAWG
jgi:hypothetical protein